MQEVDSQTTRLKGGHRMYLLAEYATPGQNHEVHSHPQGQLYLAVQGLIVVESTGMRCMMPPGRMGWIPPYAPHGAVVHGSPNSDLVGYNIFLAPELCGKLPELPVVLRPSPLAHALIERMVSWPDGVPPDDSGYRILDVLIDEIQRAEADPLRLTMPSHPRLQQMAAAIAEHPADETDLDSWAERLGLSRRSITRHFRAETGMSVVEWRQTARLQKGAEMLNAGESVTAVALTLGYDSVSSFIALFRRMLGVTPARFARGPADPALEPEQALQPAPQQAA
ncbi:helix-turn-helix domain-containing protein [Massilia sp. YIM B04103]|uniref:AraC family transcriptional regulator n=1 Tax=Massilia sp. YIM B04103 TaxID=2963106 RepID=UPI00210E1449|nr:helix-turn-helix transcriptional regulator [Massilia sp. YIM B04103]